VRPWPVIHDLEELVEGVAASHPLGEIDLPGSVTFLSIKEIGSIRAMRRRFICNTWKYMLEEEVWSNSFFALR